jgi:formyltetrahydrofolate-dependent phosphoribosylglycinamide formyltransferase
VKKLSGAEGNGLAEKRLARLVVLISGNGSNLQALIDACESERLQAEIVGVICNQPQAYGLERAQQHQLPVVILPHQGVARAEYDIRLSQVVADFEPDWIILAGWMRLLSLNFLSRFPNRVINLHPALPGEFPGVRAIERAFEASRQGLIDRTGVMVHLVPDEGVDSGPALASQVVPIWLDDTVETLAERIHIVEHQLLVDTVAQLIAAEIKIQS